MLSGSCATLTPDCREKVEFVLIQPDTVGGDGGFVEQIEVAQVMNRLLAVTLPEQGDLLAGLRQMDLKE